MILQVARQVSAEPARVWRVLIDWAGQSRWIPFTTVDVVSDHDQGLGVRAVALSGFRLGRIPVGLLDNFVVTGWRPEKELEVLHLGPFFTGEGAFRLEPHHGGTRLTATEVFSLPGGKPIEAIVRLGLPLMRAGFRRSLRDLATIAEGRP
ncbi:MAG TPA: SRPBCC family protein [Propionibacteriaceae bacterium]|nr:SRPBCC family protein [Propionibacteriaceae bacterium]